LAFSRERTASPHHVRGGNTIVSRARLTMDEVQIRQREHQRFQVLTAGTVAPQITCDPPRRLLGADAEAEVDAEVAEADVEQAGPAPEPAEPEKPVPSAGAHKHPKHDEWSTLAAGWEDETLVAALRAALETVGADRNESEDDGIARISLAVCGNSVPSVDTLLRFWRTNPRRHAGAMKLARACFVRASEEAEPEECGAAFAGPDELPY